MSNYKELKNAFYEEIKKLNRQIGSDTSIINRYNRIAIILLECKGKEYEESKPEKLIQTKKYYPNLADDYEMYERFGTHMLLLKTELLGKFDPGKLISDIDECVKKYGFPNEKVIAEMKRDLDILAKITSINIDRFYVGVSRDELYEKYKIDLMKLSELVYIVEDVYFNIGNKIIDKIEEELKVFDVDNLPNKIEENENRLELIEKYNLMFSYNKLLTKFKDQEELDEFIKLIKELLDEDKVNEIVENIKLEQEKEEEVEEVVNISFDNLDLEKFNEEERKVIRDIHKIIEQEDLNESDTLNINNYVYEEILSIYQKESINRILVDIKNNLISKIYDNKEEVINIFKHVIVLYQKYVKNRIREEQEKEFLRIRDDFSNIISFINRTYMDRSIAFEKTKTLQTYFNNIENEYLPTLRELIIINYDEDDYYDKEFERLIGIFKGLIKEYKKEMSLFNSDNKEEEDIKEDTDNLVFCLSDDIDLPDEGYENEFVGTVNQLELKSIIELKSKTGRKDLSKIRESDYSERSLISRLETKEKTKLNFVPYRYSSESNYRTGLIKFEPSEIVKKHLEDRYGLSRQSAIFGIFKVICVPGADHSEYSYLRNYINDNLKEIINLAYLFSSNNPDFTKLDNEIDRLLSNKKEILNRINNKRNRK